MNYAIEIVQEMYDKAKQEYAKTPLYKVESVELATRMDTLAQVLYELNDARKDEEDEEDEEDDGMMNLESLILNILEMRTNYDKRLREIAKQKGDAVKQLQEVSALRGAIIALGQVLDLVDPGEDDE